MAEERKYRIRVDGILVDVSKEVYRAYYQKPWGPLLPKYRLLTGICHVCKHSNQRREMWERSLFLWY